MLTIAVKGGEAIMKPKKKSRLFSTACSAQSTVVAFADDCQRVTHGIGYRINAMIATIRLAIETPKAGHDCTSAMR